MFATAWTAALTVESTLALDLGSSDLTWTVESKSSALSVVSVAFLELNKRK
jgi:hypothetical protein